MRKNYTSPELAISQFAVDEVMLESVISFYTSEDFEGDDPAFLDIESINWDDLN